MIFARQPKLKIIFEQFFSEFANASLRFCMLYKKG